MLNWQKVWNKNKSAFLMTNPTIDFLTSSLAPPTMSIGRYSLIQLSEPWKYRVNELAQVSCETAPRRMETRSSHFLTTVFCTPRYLTPFTTHLVATWGSHCCYSGRRFLFRIVARANPLIPVRWRNSAAVLGLRSASAVAESRCHSVPPCQVSRCGSYGHPGSAEAAVTLAQQSPRVSVKSIKHFVPISSIIRIKSWYITRSVVHKHVRRKHQ